MLHTLYTDNKGHGSEVELVPDLKDDRDKEAYVRKRTQWHLLDREVCIVAFAGLLGIGVKNFYRDVHLAIDGRRALDHDGPLHPKETPQMDVCHQFFRDLYMSAAEPLPQGTPSRFAKDDLSDDSDDLEDWNPDRPVVELVLHMQDSAPDVHVRKIPHSLSLIHI